MAEGFERKTYVEIIEDMESKAREVFGDNIQLDISSPLGMYIRSIAWELSITWDEMERSHFSHYAQYATGQDLDNIVNNFGRKRFLGTKAIATIGIVGDEGVEIPAGFRVSTANDLVFETVDAITLTGVDDAVKVQSIGTGTEYNIPAESISEVVNPISGIESVTNLDNATGATGIETDDNLRERHLQALREPATGDNLAQYRLWAREVEGVGNLRVLPTTPSAGFVTLILSNSNGEVASAELVEKVEQHIEEVRPVNAGVVVESAVAKDVAVALDVQVATGYRVQDLKPEITRKIEGYFRDVAMQLNYVSYAQAGRLILEVEGLLDYGNLTLNATLGNVDLAENEIPRLTNVEIEVM